MHRHWLLPWGLRLGTVGQSVHSLLLSNLSFSLRSPQSTRPSLYSANFSSYLQQSIRTCDGRLYLLYALSCPKPMISLVWYTLHWNLLLVQSEIWYTSYVVNSCSECFQWAFRNQCRIWALWCDWSSGLGRLHFKQRLAMRILSTLSLPHFLNWTTNNPKHQSTPLDTSNQWDPGLSTYKLKMLDPEIVHSHRCSSLVTVWISRIDCIAIQSINPWATSWISFRVMLPYAVSWYKHWRVRWNEHIAEVNRSMTLYYRSCHLCGALSACD